MASDSDGDVPGLVESDASVDSDAPPMESCSDSEEERTGVKRKDRKKKSKAKPEDLKKGARARCAGRCCRRRRARGAAAGPASDERSEGWEARNDASGGARLRCGALARWRVSRCGGCARAGFFNKTAEAEGGAAAAAPPNPLRGRDPQERPAPKPPQQQPPPAPPTASLSGRNPREKAPPKPAAPKPPPEEEEDREIPHLVSDEDNGAPRARDAPPPPPSVPPPAAAALATPLPR